MIYNNNKIDDTLSSLIEKLDHPDIDETNVIRWGSPVPSFGNLSRSSIATLGLNPSNREFVDHSGKELDDDFRRFHTLASLGIKSWTEAKYKHVKMILASCEAYFLRNPYDSWFKQLDQIISGTNASYYTTGACHLDLIPYATSCKWTGLTSTQRNALLTVAGDTLGHLLKNSPVRLLVLNGKTVIKQFECIAETVLEKNEMPEWTLCRKSKPSVKGFAYRGKINSLSKIKLRNEVLVLGFNHNIQSSFGVTTKVRMSIRDWVTKESAGVMS